MIRNVLILFASLWATCLVSAQSIEEEINNDVWYPFIESFNAYDAEAFMAIHTDDVLRVSRDRSGMIRTGEEYAESVRETCRSGVESKAKRTIEFTFESRIHNAEWGYEVGYYRYRSASGGQQHEGYGKFHVVLKKVNGKWKIAVDSDTSYDNTLAEEDFLSGTPLPPS